MQRWWWTLPYSSERALHGVHAAHLPACALSCKERAALPCPALPGDGGEVHLIYTGGWRGVVVWRGVAGGGGGGVFDGVPLLGSLTRKKSRSVQHSTVQLSTVQYSSVRYGTVQS